MTAALSALPGADLRRLCARFDRPGLRRLGVHCVALAGGGTLVVAAAGNWLVWPAMALLGVLEVALFTPLHETTHRTPFRSEWLNRIVGWVAGFVLVLPPRWFRCFHLAHHRHTQDPARDPELIGAKPLTPARYAWNLTGIPYWVAQLGVVLRTAAGTAREPWVHETSRPALVREARIYLTLYLLTAVAGVFVGGWILRLWIVPVLLGQPVLRAVLMAEHAGCPHTRDASTNTRTTLAGRAVAMLFWNANYHAEHHLVPGVPFHALPRLHSLIAGRLSVVEPGYAAAHAAIRRSLQPGG